MNNERNPTEQVNPLGLLHQAYWRDPTPDRIGIYKAIGLGGGAVCLAVLLAATQFTTKGPAAYTAIYAAIIGMPCWFYFGGVHDYYLLLGQESYPHFASKETQSHIERALLCGGFATAIALAGLSEYLAPYGSVVFLAIAVFFLQRGARFHVRLANWWSERAGRSRTEA